MKFNYDLVRITRPEGEALPRAHGIATNAGFGWQWKGRQRWDGRIREYFTRGSFTDKGTFKDHVEALHRGIEFIDGGPVDKEPLVVMPLPPESFQCGALEVLKKEIRGDVQDRSLHRTLPRTFVPRKTISR